MNGRGEVGVMAFPDVHIQQLLLPETLIAGEAGKRLLSSVGTDVNCHMAFLSAGVAAVLTLEPLLVLVRFLVLNEGVAVVEGSGAVAALHRRGSVSVQVAQMDTQVALPRDDGGTVRALVLGQVLAVLLQDVDLHGPALGEACVADLALVGLLT